MRRAAVDLESAFRWRRCVFTLWCGPANVVASFKTDFCGEVGGVSVDLVFRIAAIGLIVSLLAQVLNKAGREEIATLMTLSGVVIVLLMVADLIGSFFSSMRSIFLIY